MNWSRGFFRAWVVSGVIYVSLVMLTMVNTWPKQMRVFSIELPDKRVLDIEAADEATALRGAQEWHAANPKVAKYQITTPDGTFEVTAPDNMSEAELWESVKGHLGKGAEAPKATTVPAPPPGFEMINASPPPPPPGIELVQAAQKNTTAVKNHLVEYGGYAFFPPIILLALGLAVAWIARGFRLA